MRRFFFFFSTASGRTSRLFHFSRLRRLAPSRFAPDPWSTSKYIGEYASRYGPLHLRSLHGHSSNRPLTPSAGRVARCFTLTMGTGDTTAAMQEKAVTDTRALPSQPPPGDAEKQATVPASIACGDVLSPDVEREAVPNNAGPGSDHGPDPVDAGADADSATTAVQRWCRPRGNILRLAFAFLSFFIAGMNDAAVGVRKSSSAEREIPDNVS